MIFMHFPGISKFCRHHSEARNYPSPEIDWVKQESWITFFMSKMKF